MKFTINDYNFEIYGDIGHHYWMHIDDRDGAIEDSYPFATKAECQQDAMAYAEKLTAKAIDAKEQAENDKKYGSPVQQWASDYRDAIKL